MGMYTLTKVPVCVYPIFAIMGVAVTGASWYVSRLARSQDVVWNRRNQSPFLDVPQGFTVKLMDPNGSFNGQFYKRERL
ncbi:hypothetical protein CcCBS67573_g04036 [Chytriomyces confervae]|uniref:Uncharacterized protein n=1 Tax=Chytriomyces confervae TaxID=246404 RepID=A0A507FG17_9FUNG|nr:hypothetical protein CcCBS67573_g04036 [Chytriomyces confervae]